ncbi:hypothetical protein [Haloferula sp.]|uniref:hypothetical protein n=1 Tax=Haloferula sp. TaxID=2497595 RepID=UPI003C78BA44
MKVVLLALVVMAAACKFESDREVDHVRLVERVDQLNGQWSSLGFSSNSGFGPGEYLLHDSMFSDCLRGFEFSTVKIMGEPSSPKAIYLYGMGEYYLVLCKDSDLKKLDMAGYSPERVSERVYRLSRE